MRKATHVFTRANLSKLPVGWYTSSTLRGFTLRVLDDGSRHYAARYTIKGQSRRHYVGLGRHGLVTYQQAERKATEILSHAALGEDPRPPRGLTWGEWSSRYLDRLDVKRPEEHDRYFGRTPETTKAGEPTDDTFRVLARRWKNRPLAEITVEDVASARQEIRKGGKIKANRWLATIAACFEAAKTNGLLDKNPAASVTGYKENPERARVLDADEMTALLKAAYADRETNQHAATAIILLAMTGARTGEILATQWSHVNLEEGLIRLPDSKSGKVRLIRLPPAAVALVEALPVFGRYVIAGKKADHQKPDLKSAWTRVTAQAGLEGITPHDLRRTFSVELSRLAGVHVASRALGHASVTVTESHYLPENFTVTRDAIDKRAALMPMPVTATTPEEGGPA